MGLKEHLFTLLLCRYLEPGVPKTFISIRSPADKTTLNKLPVNTKCS